MSWLHLVRLFAIGYPLFILCDIVWLGFVMKGTYQNSLGYLMKLTEGQMHVNWVAALFVWALIVVGALVFALPRVEGLSLLSGFLWGALYGFVLYGVYDFTNLALIARWPFSIVLIDLAWGTFVNGMLVIFFTWLVRSGY